MIERGPGSYIGDSGVYGPASSQGPFHRGGQPPPLSSRDAEMVAVLDGPAKPHPGRRDFATIKQSNKREMLASYKNYQWIHFDDTGARTA